MGSTQLFGKTSVPKLADYPKGSPRWTTERRATVEAYIRVLQKKMRLQDWHITVDWDTNIEDDDAYATNTPETRARHCKIAFSNRFLDLDPYLQRQTMVHEMLHAHLFQLTDLAEATVAGLAKRSAAGIFEVAIDNQLEYTVDALADVIAPLMPEFILP